MSKIENTSYERIQDDFRPFTVILKRSYIDKNGQVVREGHDKFVDHVHSQMNRIEPTDKSRATRVANVLERLWEYGPRHDSNMGIERHRSEAQGMSSNKTADKAELLPPVLTERQKKILELRSGGEATAKSRKEVAELFGVTAARIYQLEARARTLEAKREKFVNRQAAYDGLTFNKLPEQSPTSYVGPAVMKGLYTFIDAELHPDLVLNEASQIRQMEFDFGHSTDYIDKLWGDF